MLHVSSGITLLETLRGFDRRVDLLGHLCGLTYGHGTSDFGSPSRELLNGREKWRYNSSHESE